MDESTLKSIAGQLRQPSGEHAVEVGEKMNDGNLHININTIAALQLTANDNILEIGMGNGFFVKDILSTDPSIRYTGLDFSEAMVREACKRNSGFINKGQAQFLMGDARNLPFDNAMFSKVFTVNTIYFWEDQEQVLSEIKRVLKPGGKVFIAIRPKSVMKLYPFVKYGFNMFNKKELADLLLGIGFNICEILEKKEPEQEINGEKMRVETLIVCAEKS
ncbi:SAM-dependent methyltransferase [Fulvivirga imtechensis AK7]|uniref:SAM-dependent methyltransferase n=1 Tax=Fulvivirga imtechensis AK7 TaxID=1237149 RepID=L8K0P7_9BACT|nr:class I SAM-dependent methyltransferase [Fulvivirga imtechensis]ELR73047.1 SAM-dependent methyltransferase [Fulvivirga imtechensis AK7]